MIRIISGGQTGADQAALDAAIALGLPHGGWLPRGRKTGSRPPAAALQPAGVALARYRDRTDKNVRAADGTLICSFGPLGAAGLTEALAIRHDRPLLHLDFDHLTPEQAVREVERWLHAHRIATLNVAGPRASSEPRIHAAVFALLTAIDWAALAPDRPPASWRNRHESIPFRPPPTAPPARPRRLVPRRRPAALVLRSQPGHRQPPP